MSRLARSKLGHVEWQHRLNQIIEPTAKGESGGDFTGSLEIIKIWTTTIRAVGKAALEFLRNDSEPVDIVSALQWYCAEEEQRTDTHLRACMTPMLRNKDVLRELWYRDDYIELVTGRDSASSMAVLIQVAHLDSL